MRSTCLLICSQGGSRLTDEPSVRDSRTTPGTTVFVRDLFYKVPTAPASGFSFQHELNCIFQLPVRRKSAPPRTSILATIRKNIELLALVNPHVGFTLTDLERDDPDAGRILTVRPDKEGSSLDVWRRLWGDTGVEASG
jgi:hypothetical protein